MAGRPAKRQRVAQSKNVVEQAHVSQETLDLWSATHQFSLVGGVDYESKETRLGQILERLPAENGSAVVFADKKDICAVRSIVERHQRTNFKRGGKLTGEADSQASTRASSGSAGSDSNSDNDSCVDSAISGDEVADESRFWFGQFYVHVLPPTDTALDALQRGTNRKDSAGCQQVINYSLPPNGRKYLDRFAKFDKSPNMPFVVFTMVTWDELSSRRCREVVGLFRQAKEEALKYEQLVEVGKAYEFETVLQQLNPDDEEDEEDDDGHDGEEEEDDSCQCIHCRTCTMGRVSLHAPSGKKAARVEAVHVHLAALQDMKVVAPYIAPRLKDHVCTVICLHCLNVHDPWDGWEHMFALPEGKGTVRVIFVLANNVSWHEYPDHGTFYSGAPWIDILDMDSMDQTDRLLENLVDHEIDLLGGRSDRIVLYGMSQGGAQSMLRFLRSPKQLGGWFGSVCHVPTTPHTPRDRDPLLDAWRSSVNRDRPVRLLAGGADTTFPVGFVSRDVARLREIGRFTNVQVEVQPTLAHDGWEPVRRANTKKAATKQCVDSSVDKNTNMEVPDLVFVRKHLLSMLGLASNA